MNELTREDIKVVADTLLLEFSTWYEPYFLGAEIAYLLHAAITGGVYQVGEVDNPSYMFVELLKERVLADNPLWTIIRSGHGG